MNKNVKHAIKKIPKYCIAGLMSLMVGIGAGIIGYSQDASVVIIAISYFSVIGKIEREEIFRELKK